MQIHAWYVPHGMCPTEYAVWYALHRMFRTASTRKTKTEFFHFYNESCDEGEYKMKNKKVLALLIAGTMAVSMGISACGTSTTTTSTETAADSASTETESEEVTAETEAETQASSGRITAIEGSTVTLETMGGGSMDGGAPSDMGGEAPSGDGEAPEAADGEVPEKPEGEEADGEAAEGEAPEKPEGETDAADGNADNSDSVTEAESVDGDAAEGEAPDGEAANGEAPEMPDGETPSDMGGDMAAGEEVTIEITDAIAITNADGETITVDDLAVGDTLNITYDTDGNVTALAVSDMESMGQPGEGGGEMGGGGSSAPTEYSAATEITEDTESDGETYTSTGTDENTIHVYEGANATISNATITKESDDSTGGDNSSFYGVGAAVLNTEGTTVIKDSTITTDSEGGAGVFSYGDAVTYVSDTDITTSSNTSGGIHVAGGGTLYAWNLNVETSGTSSAAIRSDRGGGTMVVDGGTYTSNGSDSPAVYVTADITINDATLTSNGAEGVCIEGLNTLNLFDSDITSSMTEDERNDVLWNIIVYQSQSGDSEEGNGTFNMTGGSITASEGGIFYTTNTESTFYLNDVDITYAEDNEFFLRATGNDNERGWGTAGSNGADTTFTADDQDMEGDIITDSISYLDFYMENGSTLKGAFVRDESAAGNGGDGETNVYISSDSTWTVTGDSVIDNLYNEGTIVDEDGNTVTIVDEDGNVLVEGTSAYTITVGSYDTTADFSGATTMGEFSDYEVEQP